MYSPIQTVKLTTPIVFCSTQIPHPVFVWTCYIVNSHYNCFVFTFERFVIVLKEYTAHNSTVINVVNKVFPLRIEPSWIFVIYSPILNSNVQSHCCSTDSSRQHSNCKKCCPLNNKIISFLSIPTKSNVFHLIKVFSLDRYQ